jgi:hypothetical protein
MQHPHEVPAASLVDDLADDILWITGLRPFHTAIDRALDIRCQQYPEVPGFGRCCGRLEVCQSPAFTCVIICGMITSWPLARWTRAIAAARSLPASNESLKLSPQPPIMAATRSISRLRTPGCRSANALAIVDFPMPGGPFRWMSRTT